MLTLPIMKKWYDMILCGEKKEEYREIKPYYTYRFMNVLAVHWKGHPGGIKQFHDELTCGWYDGDSDAFKVRFRNGYSNDSPSLIAAVTLSIGEGRPEWGAVPGEKYYVLHIHNVETEK